MTNIRILKRNMFGGDQDLETDEGIRQGTSSVPSEF